MYIGLAKMFVQMFHKMLQKNPNFMTNPKINIKYNFIFIYSSMKIH